MNTIELESLDEALDYLNNGTSNFISYALMESYNESVLFDGLITESMETAKANIKSLWERFKQWLEKFKQHCIAAYNKVSTVASRAIGSGFIASAKNTQKLANKILPKVKNKNATIQLSSSIDGNKTYDNMIDLTGVLDNSIKIIKDIKNTAPPVFTQASLGDFANFKKSFADGKEKIEDINSEIEKKFKKPLQDLSMKDIVATSEDVITVDYIPQTLEEIISSINDYNKYLKIIDTNQKDIISLVSETEDKVSFVFNAYSKYKITDSRTGMSETHSIPFNEYSTCIAEYIRLINTAYMKLNKAFMVLISTCFHVITSLSSEVREIKTNLAKISKEAGITLDDNDNNVKMLPGGVATA